MFDPLGMAGKLIAFAEGIAASILGIVDGDAVASVAVHHGETWNVGWAIANVDHVLEWNGTLTAFINVLYDVHGYEAGDYLLLRTNYDVDKTNYDD